MLVVPEHFAGRVAGGRKGERWRECGKVFPDERLLDLVGTVEKTDDSITQRRTTQYQKRGRSEERRS